MWKYSLHWLVRENRILVYYYFKLETKYGHTRKTLRTRDRTCPARARIFWPHYSRLLAKIKTTSTLIGHNFTFASSSIDLKKVAYRINNGIPSILFPFHWRRMATVVFNFVLPQKRRLQFNSRIVRRHFATVMTLNNWEMVAQPQSYVSRWRSCCCQQFV